MPPYQAEPSDSDAVARVRSLMFDYVDRVAQRLGFLRFDGHSDLAARVRDALDSESADAVMEQVQLTIARHPERLSAAQTDGDLVRLLYELFDAAVAKVEQDAEESEMYRNSAAEDLDPDPAFRRGAIQAATKNWS